MVEFIEGDIEHLPFPSGSFDGVMLSGVVHHLPDPSRCAAEVARVLRPGGKFMAFDPNRMNPFMWLYRDRSSPFYSSVGVTENERPVLAREVAAVFEGAGLQVSSHYLSGLAYRYVASSARAAAAAGLQFHRRHDLRLEHHGAAAAVRADRRREAVMRGMPAPEISARPTRSRDAA